MRNNYDKIKEFLDFSDPGKFYLALVVKRKKDNPEMDRSEQIIKNYMIPSMEKLDRVLPEMETLCDTFNARVYLYINRRSFKNTQKAMLKKLCDQLCADVVSNLNHLFDSCASSSGCGDRFWIIDVDMPDKKYMLPDSYMRLESEIKLSLFDSINNAKPELPKGDSRIKLVLPSKNGLHIVTSPFDTREWSGIRDKVLGLERKYGAELELELKKDAMVNLVYPEDQCTTPVGQLLNQFSKENPRNVVNRLVPSLKIHRFL